MAECLFESAEARIAETLLDLLLEAPSDVPIASGLPAPDPAQEGALPCDGGCAHSGNAGNDALNSACCAHVLWLVCAAEIECGSVYDERRCVQCQRFWHTKRNKRRYKFEGGYRCGECYNKQLSEQARAAAVQESAAARTPEREQCHTPEKKQRAPIVSVPSCTPEQLRALHTLQATESGQRGRTVSVAGRARVVSALEYELKPGSPCKKARMSYDATVKHVSGR